MSHHRDPRDQILAKLWQQRDELDEGQWTELWTLVWDCLGKTRYPEYNGLAGTSPEELVAGFFQDKVFLPARREGFSARPVHQGSLVVFYRNYLKDRLDEEQRRAREGKAVRIDALGNEDGAEGAIGELAAMPLADDEACLAEAGLSMAKVAEAARSFLRDQEEWVGLYLGLHYCPDKEESLALSRLAERYHIPSYHYRARELGITGPKGGLRNYRDYGRTLLGQWLGSLGIEVEPEYRKEMLAAFKILCLEALKQMRLHD